MKHTLPWNVTGIPPEAREAARSAAHREGIAVGEWLTRRILSENARAKTAIETLEVFPPAEALTIAEPGLSAAMRPSDATETMAPLDVVQLTRRLERVRPSAALKVALSCSDSPTTSDAAPATIGLSAGPEIAIPAIVSGVRMA